jgi:molybdate transport system substrate-binding protein
VVLGEAVSAADEITVSAALSLKSAFEEIGKTFEDKYPGTRVFFNFAASGTLQKQIEAGAPADVFVSASPKEMDALERSGDILDGTRSDFASNVIVLITAANTQTRLASFNDLRKSEVERIAIGNPAAVPAGAYAEEALRKLGLWDILKARLVYGEHVRQVMDYVARGEASAGMVFLTDAISRHSELKVVAEAPASERKPVLYAIAAIRAARNATGANKFIALVISKEGKLVLRKYGFKVTW